MCHLRFHRETRSREDFGGDSLDLLELLFELEQEIGVQVPDAAAADIHTVGDGSVTSIGCDPEASAVATSLRNGVVQCHE